jgi:hypothetical protein
VGGHPEATLQPIPVYLITSGIFLQANLYQKKGIMIKADSLSIHWEDVVKNARVPVSRRLGCISWAMLRSFARNVKEKYLIMKLLK